MENKVMDKNSKKLWILLGAVVVIVIIIIVAVQGNKPTTTAPSGQNTSDNGQGATAPTATTTAKEAATSTPSNPALKDATVVVPGANPITKDNVVVTSAGVATKNDVGGSSPLAPQQTLNIPKESLAASVIKLEISEANGFVPSTFTVKAGAAITVSLTNKDTGKSRTLAFTDSSLVGVILGTPPGETRAISFNAPAKAGSYSFIDGIPGHNGTGTMIVK